MLLTFLGTRGYIEPRTRKHYSYTATMITYNGKKIMIDCGLDWARKIWRIKPHAIVLTHAHPDHAFGLKNGSPCPVYASKKTWKLIANYLIADNLRHTLLVTKPTTIFGVRFQSFANIHSIKAPAVSFRISIGKKTLFYTGDIAYIPNIKKVLKNVLLYIGDGATITQSLIRRHNNDIYGHASIKTQLVWCKKAGVKHAIFTHCGSAIVAHAQKSKNQITELAKQKGIQAQIAYDGLTLRI